MLYEISTKELSPQITATMRVCIKPEKISAILGEVLPEVWHYLNRLEIYTAGPPFARYHDLQSDLVDMEAGFPIVKSVSGKGQIEASELPGGLAAFTWHYGPYDHLTRAYRALEEWIDEQGWVQAGPPWEVYWTDPGEVPSPADWKTEILWPVRSKPGIGSNHNAL
jgi:effector-binding domain-containing protein